MLAGQPGVIDVVKLVQKQPLKEWVTVYFDPAKTNPEKVLKHLREKESPEAALVSPGTKEKSGVRVVVENPVAGPGDLVQLTVRLPQGTTGSAKVTPPMGWRVAGDPAANSDVLRLDVQVPGPEKTGSYEGTLVVNHGDKKEAVTLPFAVELVPRVEPKVK